MMNVKLEAPWMTFRKMVKALFEGDSEIMVGEIYDDGKHDYAFDISVTSHEKYVALDRAMPKVRSFGNVTLGIYIYDEENNPDVVGLDVFETLFKGNPILKDIKTQPLPDQLTTLGYVRFQPDVIQFFNDDISDYNGNLSILAADIAYIVFEDDHRDVYFCTAPVNENDDTSK